MAIRATDTTLTGTLTDSQGNTVNGTLTMTLQGYGATVPLISGSQALPGLTITTAVSSGVFSISFYSNQIITPGPLVTFYNISFQPSITTTTIFAFSENFQFSPGTFDFSQLVPLGAVVPGRASPTFVAPNVFTAQPGQFLTGLTSSGNFTTGPTNLTLIQANGVRGWSSGNTSPLAAADTGLSRIVAKTIAVGNGTQGDASGTLQASTVNNPGGNVNITPSAQIPRIGSGSGNGDLWGTQIQNSGNTDIYILAASSSAYTTGGLINWIPNSSLALYHSSQNFLVGAGTSSTGAVNFDSTGRNITFSNLGVAGWTSGSPSSAADSGFSRTASATVAVGNGTQGDASGTLKAAAITSASLVGASNGNTVTLLNVQDGTGSIAGTGAEVVMYTYTLPANTVAVGKVLRITVAYNHTTGSAGTTINFKINGQSVIFTNGQTDNSVTGLPASSVLTAEVHANAATTSVGMARVIKSDGSAFAGSNTASSLTWGSNQTVTATFTVANTDAFTGRMFMVELIQ